MFFLCELRQGPTHNFRGRGKTKKTARDIYKRTLHIEFERDRSIGLGAKLGDEQKIKNHFSSFRDFFSGKADSVILLGFECTINSQNLIKIVRAIFEKIKFFIFFSCELPLILGVGWKLKKNGSRYLQEDPRYRI